MFKLKLLKHLERGDRSGVVSALRDEGFGPRTLTELHQLVTAELSSERFARVQLVVKALEKLSENEENLEALLNSGLTSKLLWWYKNVLEQLTCDLFQTPALKNLTKAFYDCFLELAKPSVSVSQLRVVLQYLSRTALEPTVPFRLRLEAIHAFNCCLESSSPEQKKALQAHEDIKGILSEMAAALFTVGDYELQACLLETLCRLTFKADRPIRAREWFGQEVSHAFTNVRNAIFEADCRRFLNTLNSNHGDQRRVYTFPCLQAFLDSTELSRPQDENMEEFWVDFNLGSECLSFFVDDPKMRETRSIWESIHVLRNNVNSCSLKEVNGVLVLVVDLIEPLLLENFQGQRMELKFGAGLLSDLSRVIGRVFKKRLVPVSSMRTYHKRTPHKKKLRVLPMSSPGSDEDSMIKSTERSRAEILFDQIQHSTPICKSKDRLKEEEEPDCCSLSEVMGCVRKRPFPNSALLLSTSSSEEGSAIKDATGSARKRLIPDSGYLSDRTMATPQKVMSPVESTGPLTKEDEIVEQVIVERVELAVEEDSAYVEEMDLLTDKTQCFVEKTEAAAEEELVTNRAKSGKEVLAKGRAESGKVVFVKERAKSGKEKELDAAGEEFGATEEQECDAKAVGSTAEEDTSVKVKWEWSAESVEQLPEPIDLQSQSHPAEMQVLRFQTKGVTTGIGWKYTFELEGARRLSTSQLSHNFSWTWKPKSDVLQSSAEKGEG